VGVPMLWPGVLLGWFRRASGRERAGKELFLFAAAGYLVALLLLAHVIQFRYVVPLLPFLLIWAANGVAELADWARATARTLLASAERSPETAGIAWWSAGGLAIASFVVFGVAGVRYVSEINEGFAENLIVKEAGLWLRQ